MDSRANIVTNRIVWMDVAKDFAIILMVAGHTTIPKYASDFIWAFHMPLFFIASGWMTNWEKESLYKFVLRKGRNLLIPFISYSTIVLLCFSFFLTDKNFSLLNVLSNGWGGIALWFIPVLFFFLIIAKCIIDKKNDKLIISSVIFLALLGSCLNYFRISLPWTLTSIPFAAALVIIGKFASRRARFLARYSWAVLVAGAVLTLIVSHYFRLDMAYNQVFPVSVTIIGAISGTVMVFVSSMLISKNENVISKLLSKVGKETMMILALSQLVIKMLKEYTDYGSFARYGLLIIVLFVFKYIKDYLNNFIGFKLF